MTYINRKNNIFFLKLVAKYFISVLSALVRSIQSKLTFSADYLRFIGQFYLFKKKTIAGSQRFEIKWQDLYPCLDCKTATTEFDRHYIYHTAWASRVIAVLQPERHVDISSTLYFCSTISAFVQTEFYDYRPPQLELNNLVCRHADLLHLPFVSSSIHSLSCMHVVEHIGLGRYGDPLDPDGDLKAIKELKRVLAVNGSLLLVVPIGKPKIMFNAHRIYSYQQILEYFSELHLKEFALIPDHPQDGGLVYTPSTELLDTQNYACGCFWFTRLESN